MAKLMLVKEYYYLPENQWIHWVLIVTVIHEDNDASV